MKVLLIQPPLLFYTRIIKSPNIGLASIAGVLEEAGIEVHVIDANAEGLSLDINKCNKNDFNKNILTFAGCPLFSFTDN